MRGDAAGGLVGMDGEMPMKERRLDEDLRLGGRKISTGAAHRSNRPA